MVDPDSSSDVAPASTPAEGVRRASIVGDKPGDWMKSEIWLANVGHVLAGYVWLLTTAYFARGRGWKPLIVSESILIALVLFKEYVIDLRFESDETVGSSTVDALGYALGSAVAMAVVYFGH